MLHQETTSIATLLAPSSEGRELFELSRVEKGAVLDSENHRYLLTRIWNKDLPLLCLVMLNPSDADHERNDPTILNCIRFARHWRYGGIIVVNLFSYRTSKPRQLYALDYAAVVGALNNRYISEAVAESDRTIVAWGNHGIFNNRDLEVLGLIRERTEPMCFGLTKSNMPLHPLARGKYRIPLDVKLRPYVGR